MCPVKSVSGSGLFKDITEGVASPDLLQSHPAAETLPEKCLFQSYKCKMSIFLCIIPVTNIQIVDYAYFITDVMSYVECKQKKWLIAN